VALNDNNVSSADGVCL